MKRIKKEVPTNYRIVMNIGKNGSVSKADGKGVAFNEQEAIKMYSSIVSKTANVINSELYFQGKLIMKK